MDTGAPSMDDVLAIKAARLSYDTTEDIYARREAEMAEVRQAMSEYFNSETETEVSIEGDGQPTEEASGETKSVVEPKKNPESIRTKTTRKR